MGKLVKLDLGNDRGSIWIEVDEVADEKRSGRRSAKKSLVGQWSRSCRSNGNHARLRGSNNS
jgi:hypothetical protein